MPLTSSRFAGNARLQKAALNKPPLMVGEPQGDAVALLQQALADLGFKLPITFRLGSADGIYGAETAGVVRAFQAKNSLKKDGKAGRDVLTALDKLFPVVKSSTLPPAPGPNKPVPADYGRLRIMPTTQIQTKVFEVLQAGHPIGTQIAATIGGVDLLFAVEWHYSTPDAPRAPRGWHKGISVYQHK